MKFFVAFLTIVLVAQVSFAASIQAAANDGDDLNSYLMFKSFVASVAVGIENFIKDIPDAAEYTKYKHEFEDLLKMYHSKNEDVSCYDKMSEFLTAFLESTHKIDADKSEVAKKMVQIIDKQYTDFDTDKYLVALLKGDHPNSAELLEVC